MADSETKDKRREVEGLSLAELARTIHAPETTCRRWAIRFAPYLAGKKERRWHFPAAAVSTMTTIMEMVHRGASEAAIEAELRQTIPQTIEVELTSAGNPTPSLQVVLSRIADALERLEQMQDLARRVEALEQSRRALPLWSRLTRKKPTE